MCLLGLSSSTHSTFRNQLEIFTITIAAMNEMQPFKLCSMSEHVNSPRIIYQSFETPSVYLPGSETALEVFLGKGVLKIWSKFTGEHPCWSVISIKLLCKFIEITLQHECSPVNLLHIFRTPFPKNTSGGLLLLFSSSSGLLTVNICSPYQNCIQNSVKHLNGTFCENSWQISVVNYRKKLYLKYLSGF